MKLDWNGNDLEHELELENMKRNYVLPQIFLGGKYDLI